LQNVHLHDGVSLYTFLQLLQTLKVCSDVLRANTGIVFGTGKTRFDGTAVSATISIPHVTVVALLARIHDAIATGEKIAGLGRTGAVTLARAHESFLQFTGARAPISVLIILIIALFSVYLFDFSISTRLVTDAGRPHTHPSGEDRASHGTSVIIVRVSVIALLIRVHDAVAAIACLTGPECSNA